MKISYRFLSLDASETPSDMRWITTKQKVRVLIPINATKEEIGNAIKKKYEELGIPLQSKEQKKSVYTGSGTHWEKPDAKAIGSGYGTQTHGWGFYFTKNRNAAKYYREILTPWKYKGKEIKLYTDFNDEIITAAKWYKNQNQKSLFEEKLENVKSQLQRLGKKTDLETLEKKLKEDTLTPTEKRLLLLEGIKNGSSEHNLSNGQVTRARIPSDKYLLDKRKPLQEQSGLVKNACKRIVDFINNKYKNQIYWNGVSGPVKSFYNKIAEKLGSQEGASKLLNKFGIKGISYKGTETEGDCFVIFNPDDIRIQKRNVTGDSDDTKEK